MDKTTIYRLEHPATETGPWCADGSDAYCQRELVSLDQRSAMVAVKTYLNKKTNMNTHRGVYDDFGWSWNERLRCACPSLDTLNSWFLCHGQDFVDMLHHAGFKLYAITLNAGDVWTASSKLQCAFDQDADCEKVEIPFDKILDMVI